MSIFNLACKKIRPTSCNVIYMSNFSFLIHKCEKMHRCVYLLCNNHLMWSYFWRTNYRWKVENCSFFETFCLPFLLRELWVSAYENEPKEINISDIASLQELQVYIFSHKISQWDIFSALSFLSLGFFTS